MTYYDHLFQKGKIGGLTAANRIIMPAMGTGLATPGGEVTGDLVAHYRRRSLGGAGTIIVEIACVDSQLGRAGLNQINIDHPRYLKGLTELAEAIKFGGANAFIQLHHAGRQTTPLAIEGRQPIAPSPVACRFVRVQPRAMTVDEIRNTIDRFVAAAQLAKLAGFDGVELHAAHGYLLSEFLSPYTNHRDDEYGGDTEGRFRMLREIIQGIRQTLGRFPLSVRFNMHDFVRGGTEVEEGKRIASLLDECGVDLLNVTCGIYESGITNIEPTEYKEGWRLYLADAARSVVKNTPIAAGGVIRTPAAADRVIAEKRADFVWLGRQLLADPDWPRKAREGRENEIRPCLSCNLCIGQSFKGLPVRCTVNPSVGRDHWPSPAREGSPRRVLVVGAGPAGMQAAVSLSSLGHGVTLIDKAASPGGLLYPASVPPHKERLHSLLHYLQGRLSESQVDLRLNTPLTPELIAELSPDYTVLAWGQEPWRPDVPGNERGVDAVRLLEEGINLDKGTSAVIIGGGSVGLETAEWLAGQGALPTVVELLPHLARDMENMNRLTLLRRIADLGIPVIKPAVVTGVEEDRVMIEQEGKTISLPCNLVVWACGTRPRTVPPYVYAKGGTVLTVGDASGGGDIFRAVSQGYWTASRVR